MTRSERVRTALNWINLTTPCGLLLARLGRARVRRAPGGLLIAGNHRLPVPAKGCFTVGSVVLTREPAEWLLSKPQQPLLGHEARHATQYAVLGPLFWPLYGLAAAWSWLTTGGYAARNVFERHAGLDSGGYTEAPLRGWAARLVGLLPRPR